MKIFRLCTWAASPTGTHPTTPGALIYEAMTFEDAIDGATTLANQHHIPTSSMKVFFRVQLTAHTNWEEVNANSDYDTITTRLAGQATADATTLIIDDLDRSQKQWEN